LKIIPVFSNTISAYSQSSARCYSFVAIDHNPHWNRVTGVPF
jgi:hypothetical protein